MANDALISRTEERNNGQKSTEGASRKRLAVLMFLVLLFILTMALAVRYLITRQPIQSSLPPVTALVNIPPRYQFSFANVSEPLGVAVSPDGNRIYVTEGDGAKQIVIFDRSGKEVSRFAPPNTSSVDRFPLYIATYLDKVYVTDRLRHTLDIYDLSGKYLSTFPPPNGETSWSPMGIAFDKTGNTLVTDSTVGKHRLLVFDPEGNQILSVGSEGMGEGQFSFPNGVAADDKGRIYVADGNNGRVQVFDLAGNLLETLGSNIGIPRGMAIDSEQRLHVVDTTDHSVSVWSINGTPKLLFNIGSPGFGSGQFKYPNGIAFDSTGRVYITDRENQRVQVWTY